MFDYNLRNIWCELCLDSNNLFRGLLDTLSIKLNVEKTYRYTIVYQKKKNYIILHAYAKKVNIIWNYSPYVTNHVIMSQNNFFPYKLSFWQLFCAYLRYFKMCLRLEKHHPKNNTRPLRHRWKPFENGEKKGELAF